MSFPSFPVRESSPPPPRMQSSPPRPSMASAPELPMIRSFPLVPVRGPDPLMICASTIPLQAEGFISSAVTGADCLPTFDDGTAMPAAKAVATLTTIKANSPKITSWMGNEILKSLSSSTFLFVRVGPSRHYFSRYGSHTLLFPVGWAGDLLENIHHCWRWFQTLPAWPVLFQ